MCTLYSCALNCGSVISILWWWFDLYSHIFSIASLAQGQSYDFSSAGEQVMGEVVNFIRTNPQQNSIKDELHKSYPNSFPAGQKILVIRRQIMVYTNILVWIWDSVRSILCGANLRQDHGRHDIQLTNNLAFLISHLISVQTVVATRGKMMLEFCIRFHTQCKLIECLRHFIATHVLLLDNVTNINLPAAGDLNQTVSGDLFKKANNSHL